MQFLPTVDIDDEVATLTYAAFTHKIRQCANLFRASGIMILIEYAVNVTLKEGNANAT